MTALTNDQLKPLYGLQQVIHTNHDARQFIACSDLRESVNGPEWHIAVVAAKKDVELPTSTSWWHAKLSRAELAGTFARTRTGTVEAIQAFSRAWKEGHLHLTAAELGSSDLQLSVPVGESVGSSSRPGSNVVLTVPALPAKSPPPINFVQLWAKSIANGATPARPSIATALTASAADIAALAAAQCEVDQLRAQLQAARHPARSPESRLQLGGIFREAKEQEEEQAARLQAASPTKVKGAVGARILPRKKLNTKDDFEPVSGEEDDEDDD